MALVISRDQAAGELLESEIRRAGPHALVMLAGEIDASTVGKLYEELAAAAREGVRHVSLHLAEVTFVDSTGLSLLVTEHKRMESMGGELIIFSPSRQLLGLLQMTALDSYLNVRPLPAS